MPRIPTTHPNLVIVAGSRQARRNRHLIEHIETLAEHLVPAVAHATRLRVPRTLLSISSPVGSAWSIEAVLHKNLIGPQPPLQLLHQGARSWWTLSRGHASTTLYQPNTAWIAVNPRRLRTATADHLVDVLGHELVRAAQLTTAAGTSHLVSNLHHRYGTRPGNPITRASADLAAAQDALTALQAAAAIREAVHLHRAGSLPARQPAAPRQAAPWDLLCRAETSHDQVSAGHSTAQHLLQELRSAAPTVEIADWIRDLGQQLAELEGQQGAARRLTAAVDLLEQAAVLTGESTGPAAALAAAITLAPDQQ